MINNLPEEKSNESLIPEDPNVKQSPFQIQTQYVPSAAEIDEQLEIFADIIVSVIIKDLDKKGANK
jgi:hypothetical protein